jgi:hypothetical protein
MKTSRPRHPIANQPTRDDPGGRIHRAYKQGGKADPDAPRQRVPCVAGRNRSWLPGRKRHGGEGLSEGYGGSSGEGTGPSGPEDKDNDPQQPRRIRNRL